MTTAATISARLILDSKPFDDSLKDSGKKAKDFQTRLGKMGGTFLKIGKAAAVGFAAVGGGATAALASTIAPASKLEESINAIDVTFGKASNTILEYGKTASETVGLSNSEFNSLSTTTGAFLQNLGYDASGAAKKTIELTERAADMASVFDTDVSQALGAIQSGLKGEFNPLEQFGVKINAAAIEAKALSMGLVPLEKNQLAIRDATVKYDTAVKKNNQTIKKHGVDSIEARKTAVALEKATQKLNEEMAGSTGEITDAAKAQAALALVMEQTDKVQGDFANTSDSVANVQRRLAGRFEDIKAKIGSALLPVLSKLGSKFIDVLNNPKTEKFIDKIVKGIGNMANVFGDLVMALQGGGISDVFTVFADGHSIIGSILEMFGVTGKEAKIMAKEIKDGFYAVKKVVDDLIKKFKELTPEQKVMILKFVALIAVLGPVLTVISGLIGTITAIVSVVSAVGGALSAIVPVVAAIAGAVMSAIGFIGGLLSTVFSALVALVGVIGLPVIALIAAVALLAFLLHKYGAQVWVTIKQIWFIVKFYFTKMRKDILKIWVGMGVAISTFWSNLWTNIQNKFLAIKASIVKKIADMLVSIIRFFMDIEWSTIGKNIVRGIVNGIASLAGWAWSQMTKFARGMSDSFKNFFGIHSPSKLFEDYGKSMTAGLVIGLEPMSDAMLGTEKAVDGSFGASNKNTVINLTLPSGVITKTMMGDILGTNNAEFSENLAMAMTL